MIIVKNLTKTFGAFTAVDNLSLEVKEGEVLGFLGPNGAGKSTTMKMITGFLAPTAGSVTICDHDIESNTLAAQELIGYLPEGAPCYGDMTPLEFLQFIAEIRGFHGSEKAAKVNDAVERLALKGVLHQSIDTLSKGFKRRVGLAQAILHDPKVLILDEPTDGLDPNQKHQVRNLILNLAKDKIVIISTHILEEVTAVCTRAVIIARGKVVMDGTPLELESQSPYHQAVTIRFKQPIETMANGGERPDVALAKLAGVEKTELESNQIVTVFPKAGAAIFETVNQALVQHDWEIEGLYTEKGRLDDVFRRITQEVA